MTTRDERLSRELRGAYGGKKAPAFEAAWRRAEERARDGSRGTIWRWALGPALAAVSAAVFAVVLYGGGGAPGREGPGTAKAPLPALVAIADAGAAAAPGAGAVASDEEAETGTLYVAGTDFLLELNLPAWN